MTRRRPWRAALAGTVLLIACHAAAPAAAQQQPLVQTVEEHDNARGEIDKRSADFVHRASGYVYPGMLGEMPARKTVTYGSGDAAVNYTLYGGGNNDAWIDVYVYPATQSLADEAAGVEAAILDNFQPTRVSAPGGWPAGPENSLDGWFDGSIRESPVLSGYRVARRGDWFIKVRVTIPRQGGDEALQRAMVATAAVPWSMPAVPVAADLSQSR